jgi:hypothetical protein
MNDFLMGSFEEPGVSPRTGEESAEAPNVLTESAPK